MRIGIDFDNTLASYEIAFPTVARMLGLLSGQILSGRREVKACLQNTPGGEQQWQRLQGQVYGRYMHLAEPMDGSMRFLQHCRANAAKVYIVSHKTLFGHYDASHTDLRQSALEWMDKQAFFCVEGAALERKDVFFASTQTEKVECIHQLGLDYFIDDLSAILLHERFPPHVQAVLFDPSGRGLEGLKCCRSWEEVLSVCFSS